MPWKVSDPLSERIKFIGRLLEGERMSDLCREFEISRKTGYKIYERYARDGLAGLGDKPRLPRSRPNQTSCSIQKLITNLRESHPSWGAAKIREYLQRKHTQLSIPAKSTVHSVLLRHDLIQKKKRSTPLKMRGTDLVIANHANHTWCADFKGQFRMGDKKYCYPLTMTDQYSRFLLSCEALESVREEGAFPVFTQAFRDYGLPLRIRTDNGVPFATKSLFGLSSLSVWWLRLGIQIERIEPGHPEQNGRHERMHRTLKETLLKTPAKNLLQQQEAFDSFCESFNRDRPHQALGMKCPADIYQKSERIFKEPLEDLEYPKHEKVFRVSKCGSINVGHQKRVFISEVFRGQVLGSNEVEEGIWEVSFMNSVIGHFDSEAMKLTSAENPFLTKTQLSP